MTEGRITDGRGSAGTSAADEPANVPDLFTLLREHLPLVATAAVLTLVFTRLLVVSHGNPETFRALLSSAGPVEVIFGSLVQSLPEVVVTPTFFLVASYRNRWPRIQGASLRVALGLWVVAYLIVAVLVLLVTTDLLTVVSFGAVLVGFAVHVLASAFRADGESSELRLTDVLVERPTIVLSVLLLLMLWAFLQRDTPWLPAETIRRHASDDLVGYVVHADEDSLVVLTENTRQVLRIAKDDVRERELCSLGDNQPVLDLSRAAYPECTG